MVFETRVLSAVVFGTAGRVGHSVPRRVLGKILFKMRVLNTVVFGTVRRVDFSVPRRPAQQDGAGSRGRVLVLV